MLSFNKVALSDALQTIPCVPAMVMPYEEICMLWKTEGWGKHVFVGLCRKAARLSLGSSLLDTCQWKAQEKGSYPSRAHYFPYPSCFLYFSKAKGSPNLITRRPFKIIPPVIPTNKVFYCFDLLCILILKDCESRPCSRSSGFCTVSLAWS